MSAPFIGEIKAFAGNTAPKDWIFCNGQLLTVAGNAALHAVISNTYGGNATHFNVPDLRGRVAVHPGSGGINLASTGGANTQTLNTAQLPAHTHAINIKDNAAADEANPGSAQAFGVPAIEIYYALSPNATASGYIVNTGSGTAVSIMQPYCGVNYIICFKGVFPFSN